MDARRFVIGDIHGAGQAFEECLSKVDFNYEKDILISLGDVCDGWPEVSYAVELLLKIKNLHFVMGNHDQWALEWMKTNDINPTWLSQGGSQTMASYEKGVPDTHIRLLDNALDYYILENKLFVHGGIIPDSPLSEQTRDIFLWDRSLLRKAMNVKDGNISDFNEIYVGHTPTLRNNSTTPLQFTELWMLDTGAGWRGGKLTIMDIDTKQYWQSRNVELYYPGVKARG